MSPSAGVVGVVGLGNMGRVLAGNLVAAGHQVVAHDQAGTEDRAPAGATAAGSVGDVAAVAETVLLSLPAGDACTAVLDGLLAEPRCVVRHVVDTSTVGVAAARALAARAAERDVTYVDAPVSGGVAGAVQRAITLMFAGPDRSFAELEPVLAAISARVFHVGTSPGLGQAVKLANNFLSATAMAATSEALAFGVRVGLDPETMLDVINQSSGRSTASGERFPRHVLTARYDAGFRSALMQKDLGLYLAAATDAGAAAPVSAPVTDLWRRFAAAEPDADYTRIHPFVEGLAPD